MRFPIACFAAASLAALATASCGARSALIVTTNDAVVCPLGAYAARVNQPVDLRVTAPPEARGLLRWDVESAPAGASPQLTPDGAFGARFASAVEGGYDVRVGRTDAPPRDA